MSKTIEEKKDLIEKGYCIEYGEHPGNFKRKSTRVVGALVGRFPEIMFALQRARPCELAFVVFECHLVIRSSRWSEGPAAIDSVSL